MNTPGGNTLSAAEHTCALICCLSRDIPNAVATMRAGKWDRKNFMGSELYGKTLGIIGLGRIGKEVALRMQSFGMTTIGYDPIIPGTVSAEFGVEWMELEHLWPRVDYITVHTPLIPQTTNLINDAVFAKCKARVRVVNCARGGIIDEDALLKALESGQCGGAGLDVYINEPPTDYKLAQHPKVIATPHLGASTVEAQKRVAVEIAEQFVDLMKGKSLFGAINAQAMNNALSPDTRPWVELGRCLGTLLGKLGVNPKHGVSLLAYGQVLKNAGQYLSAAVLAGLLGNSTHCGCEGLNLNLVSAPALAKKLGIQVQVSMHDIATNFHGPLVLVTIDNQTVGGTASGGQPLLESINGTQFSPLAALSGQVIVFKASADPGLLATIAGLIAGKGAHIQGLSVSGHKGGTQWGVVNLQTAPEVGLHGISAAVQSAFSISF
ncbi:hypothetical protein DPMN_057570 [Dreissena polymorpha]|uniref:phosphoglycerate dehydrogenase n=2 Tax=Dreissena polymorpha TaxID=45954 RepID=A0A9D4C0G7_DREPO|nr:hypothetical protein DPMN_057570 [Dreissena polymorpha]